ncbi:MAG: addiction module protein [Planctomycetota bacterium]
MSGEYKEVQRLALKLPAIEKARLVDALLASLDRRDRATDRRWKKEIEDRIEAYRTGRIKSVPLGEVLARYRTE